MRDIFLSYSSKDKARAQIIAEAFEAKGCSVWWAPKIPPGKTWDEVIKEALNSAKCVIVLWSHKSVSSDWVKEEAEYGKKRRILIPVLIDDVEIPFGFGRIQAAKLIDWDGTPPHPEFDLLLDSISEILGRPVCGDTESGKKKLKGKMEDDAKRTKQIEKLSSQFTQAEREKDWYKMIESGENILKLSPDHRPTRPKIAMAYNERGKTSFDIKEYDSSINDYNQAIEHDPKNAEYYYSRGTSYYYKDEYDMAIVDFDCAIKLKPKHYSAYSMRGLIYRKKGDFDSAIADFNSAIKLNPNEASYYYGRGLSYELKEDHDRAIADYNRAIQHGPNRAEHYNQRGVSYRNKGDYERAIGDFNQAIKLDPDNAEYHYSRGLSYKLKGDKKAAKLDFQRATELGNEDAKKELAKKETKKTEDIDIPKTYTNSIGMKFILIPAGEFMMGSEENDSEKRVHKVKINKPFYLGIYPVTQREWKEVIGINPSYIKGDELPVENVSWDDVQEFIKKINEKEGTSKYRLPSEAEWEYAARAGTTTKYSFGDDESELGDFAWYADNSGSKTHEVGQKKPNSWGLYDMHGNVWEWVQDSWHDNYKGAPEDGSAWEGDGSIRVFRGGGWGTDARSCRSAVRDYIDPGYRSYDLGFRLLRIL